MAFTSRDGISIFILLAYLVAFFIAVWLSINHGIRRSAGWIYLVFLSLLRIVGSSAQLTTISHPSKSLYTTIAICFSIGLSPLILLSLGLLARVNDSLVRNTKKGAPPKIFHLVTVTTLVALVLCILGINSSSSNVGTTSSTSQVDGKTKAGIILLLISWTCLSTLLVIVFMHMSNVDAGEKRLLLAVAISLPLILVRLIYSILGDFTNHSFFNPLTGSVATWLCMAVLTELVVVYACLIIGSTLKSAPRNASVNPMPAGKQSRHDIELQGRPSEEHSGQFHGSYVEQGIESRPARLGRRGRGGPLYSLIGMAVDRLDRSSHAETRPGHT